MTKKLLVSIETILNDVKTSIGVENIDVPLPEIIIDDTQLYIFNGKECDKSSMMYDHPKILVSTYLIPRTTDILRCLTLDEAIIYNICNGVYWHIIYHIDKDVFDRDTIKHVDDNYWTETSTNAMNCATMLIEKYFYKYMKLVQNDNNEKLKTLGISRIH